MGFGDRARFRTTGSVWTHIPRSVDLPKVMLVRFC